jgi:hypothetical protein
MDEQHRLAIRRAVRVTYDLQKIRIQVGNRGSKAVDTSLLSEGERAYMTTCSNTLEGLEKASFKELERLCKPLPVYKWLRAQKGCGPAMAGVIISEFDVTQAPMVSAFWAYAGLAVDTRTNQAQRRVRGEKANYNHFLRTKLLGVLAGSMLKCNSPWRKHYDDYKHGKTSAGWGKNPGHIHQASMRYMIKCFLTELWEAWRKIEGLPTPETYGVAKMGVVHGEHGVRPQFQRIARPERDDEAEKRAFDARLTEAAIEADLNWSED